MNLCSSVHNLEKFWSNPGTVHIEILLHWLIYIRDKNNWGLVYYAKKEYAPPSDLLRQYVINNKDQLMVFSAYFR